MQNSKKTRKFSNTKSMDEIKGEENAKMDDVITTRTSQEKRRKSKEGLLDSQNARNSKSTRIPKHLVMKFQR